MSMWSMSEFIFLIGLGSLILGYKHYLSMLLSLELIMLSIYFSLCFYISFMNISGEIILLFLSMMICEGLFGLCILVVLSRSYGSDMTNMFLL